MRQKLVDADLVDCLLRLGPNLFYNSPMEACVVICRNNEPTKQRGKVILIDATNEVTYERGMRYLKPEHQERVAIAYHDFKDVEGFAKVASPEEIRANDSNLSIPMYVRGRAVGEEQGEYATNGFKKINQNMVGEFREARTCYQIYDSISGRAK